MRKFNYLSLMLIAMSFGFVSCDDDEATPTPQAITITAEDSPVEAGYLESRSEVSFNLPQPTGGENVTWDYSGLIVTRKRGVVPYLAFSNTSTFPNAELSQGITAEYSLATEDREDSELIFSTSEDGYFEHGRKHNSDFFISIFGGAGSITFLEEDAPYSETVSLVPTPFTYKDKLESRYSFKENFKATFPPQVPANTPGATIDSVDYSVEAIGWGELKLPSYPESFEVLLLKREESRRQYYFLGGAPASSALLTGLGIEDGRLSVLTTYVFYAKNHGPVATIIFENGKFLRGHFVNDIRQ